MALAGCGLLVGCGSPDDPDGNEGDSEDASGTTSDVDDGATSVPPNPSGPGTGSGGMDSDPDDTGTPPETSDTGDTGDETTGDPPPDACQPAPTRMIVLGDSITACFGVGGANSDDCAPRRLTNYLESNLGPITYENYAVGGAVTVDVPNNQLDDIEVGIPGHAIVMIFVGGNDLSGYIFQSDDAATNGWNNTTGPQVAQAWEDILAFLGDPANFPDGVTLLMNTQYNPFDDYTAAPYFVSQTKIDLLHAHNDALTERAASQPWAFIADQHPSYLGHGHYVNDPGCPYYDATFDGWMGDLIHPNIQGHHHLTDIMIDTLEVEAYSGCE